MEWSRFLLTLIHRTPEQVADLKKTLGTELPGFLVRFRPQYESMRKPGSPTFEEFTDWMSSVGNLDSIHLQVLHSLMDSELTGTALNRMIWGTIRIDNARYPLLTSDRPLTMSNGIGGPDGYIVMPISPDRIFVATNTAEMARNIRDQVKQGKFEDRVNDFVARQARKYVYGTDDRQLRFVQNRLGSKAPWGPFRI